VRLDLHSLLPRFVLVESAKAADRLFPGAFWPTFLFRSIREAFLKEG
jgi:hypothetical protein